MANPKHTFDFEGLLNISADQRNWKEIKKKLTAEFGNLRIAIEDGIAEEEASRYVAQFNKILSAANLPNIGLEDLRNDFDKVTQSIELAVAAINNFDTSALKGLETTLEHISNQVDEIVDKIGSGVKKGITSAIADTKRLDSVLASIGDASEQINESLNFKVRKKVDERKEDVVRLAGEYKKLIAAEQEAANLGKKPTMQQWFKKQRLTVEFVSAYEGYAAGVKHKKGQEVEPELERLYEQVVGKAQDARINLNNLLARRDGSYLESNEPWAREETLKKVLNVLQSGIKVEGGIVDNEPQTHDPVQKNQSVTVYRVVSEPDDDMVPKTRESALEQYGGGEIWTDKRGMAETYSLGRDNPVVLRGNIVIENPYLIDAHGKTWDSFDKMTVPKDGGDVPLEQASPEISELFEKYKARIITNAGEFQAELNKILKSLGYSLLIVRDVIDTINPDNFKTDGSTFTVLDDSILTVEGGIKGRPDKESETGHEFKGRYTKEAIPEYYLMPGSDNMHSNDNIIASAVSDISGKIDRLATGDQINASAQAIVAAIASIETNEISADHEVLANQTYAGANPFIEFYNAATDQIKQKLQEVVTLGDQLNNLTAMSGYDKDVADGLQDKIEAIYDEIYDIVPSFGEIEEKAGQYDEFEQYIRQDIAARQFAHSGQSDGQIVGHIDAAKDAIVNAIKGIGTIDIDIQPLIDKLGDGSILRNTTTSADGDDNWAQIVVQAIQEQGGRIVEALRIVLPSGFENTELFDENKVVDAFQTFVTVINALTLKMSEAQDNIKPGDIVKFLVSGVLSPEDLEIVEEMKTLGLLSESGAVQFTLKGKDAGKNNTGIVIADNLVIRAGGQDQAGHDVNNVYEARDKQERAYRMGAAVPRVLSAAYGGDADRFNYQLQTRAHGVNLRTANVEDVLNATDEQIDKLLHTFEVLEKVELFPEFGGDNIMFDKNHGFTMIDLDNAKGTYAGSEVEAQGMVEAFIREIRKISKGGNSQRTEDFINRVKSRYSLPQDQRSTNESSVNKRQGETSSAYSVTITPTMEEGAVAQAVRDNIAKTPAVIPVDMSVADSEIEKIDALENRLQSLKTAIAEVFNNINSGADDIGAGLNNITVNVNHQSGQIDLSGLSDVISKIQVTPDNGELISELKNLVSVVSKDDTLQGIKDILGTSGNTDEDNMPKELKAEIKAETGSNREKRFGRLEDIAANFEEVEDMEAAINAFGALYKEIVLIGDGFTKVIRPNKSGINALHKIANGDINPGFEYSWVEFKRNEQQSVASRKTPTQDSQKQVPINEESLRHVLESIIYNVKLSDNSDNNANIITELQNLISVVAKDETVQAIRDGLSVQENIDIDKKPVDLEYIKKHASSIGFKFQTIEDAEKYPGALGDAGARSTEELRDILGSDKTVVVQALQEARQQASESVAAVDEMVNKISELSAIQKGLSLDELYTEAAEAGRALAAMYDEGKTDSIEFIALQYKVEKLIDRYAETIKGQLGRDAPSASILRYDFMNETKKRTGVGLNDGGVFNSLYSSGKRSIYDEHSGKKRTMKDMAAQKLGLFGAYEYDAAKSIIKDIDELLSMIDKLGDRIFTEASEAVVSAEEVAGTQEPDSDSKQQVAIDPEGLKSVLESILYNVKVVQDTEGEQGKIDINEESLEGVLRRVFNSVNDQDAPWAREDTLKTTINSALDQIIANTSVNADDGAVEEPVNTENQEPSVFEDTLIEIKGILNSIGEKITHNTAQNVESTSTDVGSVLATENTLSSIQKTVDKINTKIVKGTKAKTGDSGGKKSSAGKKNAESYAGSQYFPEKLKTQTMYLAKFRAQLLTTGRLTEDIDAQIYELLDALARVKDGPDFSRWNQQFLQLKTSVGIVDIFDTAEDKEVKASYEAIIELQRERNKLELKYQKAQDGSALKQFYAEQLAEIDATIDKQRTILGNEEYEVKLAQMRIEQERKLAEESTKQKDKQRLDTIRELIKLYEQLGALQARIEAADGTPLGDQLNQEYSDKLREIGSLKDVLGRDTISQDVQRQFDEAYSESRKDTFDKQGESNASKRTKEISRLREEIGRYQAQVDAATDTGVKNALEEEIALREKWIQQLRDGADISAEQAAYERQRAKEATRDAKKDAADAKKMAKKNAMFGKAGNAVSRAENIWLTAQGLDIQLPADVEALVDRLEDKMRSLREEQHKISTSDTITEQQQQDLRDHTVEVNSLTAEISELIAEYERLSGSNVNEDDTRINTLGSSATLEQRKKQMIAYVREITDGQGRVKAFDAATGTLTYTVKTGAHEFTEYTAAVRRADNSLVSVQGATKRTETFIEAMGRKMREISSYMSGMSLISRAGQELRRGIQYVREIDLALTELKKVTDETEEEYDKFLQTAAKTGARLGTTISAVTEATSTFAKLGYSMEQATEMAESAIVYKNVGDNIASTEDAADSIISTMKGFGLEASEAMGIVDKFNEVGNRFAITSQGIGEALRLSASALSEGSNSLDESIGLITAANEVVNDPSSVGKK